MQMNFELKTEWDELSQIAQERAYDQWFAQGVGYYPRYEEELSEAVEKDLGVVLLGWSYNPHKTCYSIAQTEEMLCFNSFESLLAKADELLRNPCLDTLYYTDFYNAVKNVCENKIKNKSREHGNILLPVITLAIRNLAETSFLDNYSKELSFENFVEFHCGEFLYSKDGALLKEKDLDVVL